jgi:RNA polymerase sigma-70 factor (ECF subfamily)
VDATSVTLLERLRRPDDQDAWARFVHLYTPLLFQLAKQCGLQPADAADLTQDVFALLVRKLPEFRYDGQKSFRAWLRSVTLNHWRDTRRRAACRPERGDGPLSNLVVPDGVELLEEGEYRRMLVARALRIMKADFQPDTWQAFWEHGVEGKSAPAVARALGLTVGAVYAARCRVVARLREELAGFLD